MKRKIVLILLILSFALVVNAEDVTLLLTPATTKEITKEHSEFHIYSAPVGEEWKYLGEVEQNLISDFFKTFFPNIQEGKYFYIVITSTPKSDKFVEEFDENEIPIKFTMCEKIGTGKKVGLYFKKEE